ncbi:MAG: N-6 DNA methylase, partial [Pseudomonadota bacterium]
DNIDKPLLDLYETGSMSTLTEVLFIERCLNLLKPGGRMGIVLPEGVLNNTNLQKIREYVESRAKILLITSIPQDVFIASGATVKPSLLFFKKFTEEETKKWKTVSNKAEKEIKKKYELKTKPILAKLELKGKEAPSNEEKKKLRVELKQIEDTIVIEIKAQIKKEFNYQIPIAEVEKAGISSTGSQIENELEPLAKEFKTYREKNKLWTTYIKEIKYQISNDEIGRVRIVDGVVSEPEVFYSKSKY